MMQAPCKHTGTKVVNRCGVKVACWPKSRARKICESSSGKANDSANAFVFITRRAVHYPQYALERYVGQGAMAAFPQRTESFWMDCNRPLIGG